MRAQQHILLVAAWLLAGVASADIVQLKDSSGGIYQVDSNVEAERGGGVSSRVRWPDNATTRILVMDCEQGRGTIWTAEKNQWSNPFSWSNDGARMVDRIASIVCNLKRDKKR